MPVPVIARVQGIATAAGCQLVAMCDLAVAASTAKFAVSGVNLGLFCSTPGVALSRNLGRKAAFEMLVTGAFISAAEAQDKGLVNRVAEPERLDLDQLIASLRPSWMAKGACVGTDPDAFFPPPGPKTDRDAKAICATCPVVDTCLEYALTNRLDGV